MSERAQVMDNIVGQFARIFDCGVGCHRRPLSQAYSLLACAGASYSLHAGSGHAATAEKNLPQSSRPRVPGLTASNALVEYYVWFFPGGRPRTAAAQHFLPSWRNWQTRMVQVHVPARVWGFESLRWHQEISARSFAALRISPAGSRFAQARKPAQVRVPSMAPRNISPVLRCAQDFACGLPLRSRPQTGSSSSPFDGTNSLNH